MAYEFHICWKIGPSCTLPAHFVECLLQECDHYSFQQESPAGIVFKALADWGNHWSTECISYKGL